ncbi:MAG: DNA cytosine methyltransferase [Sporichthyaceae bacterium]
MTALLVERSVDTEQEWLRGAGRPAAADGPGRLRTVDLFAGCGGLSLGLFEAARALGLRWEPRLAVDLDAVALGVYRRNFDAEVVRCEDVRGVFDGTLGARPTTAERVLARAVGDVDMLVGGPPCQGHSDLNNRTRRADAKNALYEAMVRAAEVLSPAHVLIENVPGALHDRDGVVQRSAEALTRLGYGIALGVVDLHDLGLAQRRRRLVLLASRTRQVSTEAMVEAHRREPRDLRWAIGDLVGKAGSGGAFDQPAVSAPTTRARIDYLFEHGLHDLPDSQRPPCHADGTHSYRSIYGRLAWDRPAQTLTRGFYSMCMGRYVHPVERRTITAHEAARLQYFPDWFDFSGVSRSQLAVMIGNAAPMRLGYAAAVEWLR